MAVAATLLTSGTGSGGTASGFTTASVSPTAYALQLLFIHLSRGGSTNPTAPTTLTGNGLTWVLVTSSAYDAAGVGRAGMWVYRALGSAPTTGTLVVSGMGADSSSALTYSWVQVTGVNSSGTHGSGAIVQTGFSSISTSDTPVATLSAFGSANNATIGWLFYRGTPSFAPSAGSGFTSLASDYVGGTRIASGVEFKASNDTSVDMSFAAGGGAGAGAIMGMEIKAAALLGLVVALDADVVMDTALVGSSPGLPLGQTTLTPDVAIGVTLTGHMPRYSRREPPMIWVHGFAGERKNVID